MQKGLGKLNPKEIEDLLLSQATGRLGCHADGKTLVMPITYAYDGTRIIAHSGVGEKIAMMRTNPNVCFEVEEVEDLRNWRSVIVQGVYKELKGNDASLALSFFVDKLTPLLPNPVAMPGMGGSSIRPKPAIGESDTVVFCIEITEKTGRYERFAG